MIRRFIKEMTAIQWDGEIGTLNEIQTLYPTQLKAWIVNESEKSLRVTLLDHQGDYWFDIGDYIELRQNRVWHRKRVEFENNYKEIK